MNSYVFDIEGDGLNPSKIYCMSVGVGNKIITTSSYDDMRSMLCKADVLIGHNIIRWDIPVLERILGIEIKAKLVDTLSLSWYLYPDRVRHGLEYWGEDFGIPKPVIEDWYNQTQEEYENRCSEDVKITMKLWNKQWKFLKKLYVEEDGAWRLIDYLSFKLDCAREQERSGWKLDIKKCEASLSVIDKEYSEAFELLKNSMPKVAVKAIRNKPKKPFNRDGKYSALGEKWFNLLKEKGLPEDYEEPVEVITGWEEPNPNSDVQIKNWLYSLGWVPVTFKYKRDKDTNEFTKIPQVRKDGDDGKELCKSVLKLTKKEPAIEYLSRITVLAHRSALLKGFLENVDENSCLKAEIQGLTNTLRFKHTTIVNLPGVDRAFGKDIRGCLIAPEGYELCGSDQSSLEDRTKQHFMWKYDPEYVKEMITPDFDPHLDLAVMSNMMTKEQVDAYKDGDHTHKPIRHKAKQVNYSCTYGVTPNGLVRNTGMALKEATSLHSAYWKRNWSIQAIADNCKVKIVNGQKWLYNEVSKLWYSLRYDKDKFSTLNQGTGTYCFDMWVLEIRKRRSQLTAQFHDEIVLCVKKGNREKAIKLLKDCVRIVNQNLKLNRDLDVDVQFGDNYADIH